MDAFISYIKLLPPGGELIYCADDKGAIEAADIISGEREDIVLIPYGEDASGLYQILDIEIKNGLSSFRLSGFDKRFFLKIPGKHLILDSAASIALNIRTIIGEKGKVENRDLDNITTGLLSFAGTKRRSEIIGEEKGILIMDDYAHHPTAIKTTLEGLKQFYPKKRLIVDFMSHTYSRTSALLDQFAQSFGSADVVVLHKIYASAREQYSGTVTGYQLFEKAAALQENVNYFEEIEDAEDFCMDILKDGDLFVTMGAGNNWQLGNTILRNLREK